MCIKLLHLICLQNSISEFMNAKFDRITSTARALFILRRFERLNLPNLGIPEKYQKILSHYGRDIEMVSKLYQKNKSDPPVARDLPPIAGKIVFFKLNYLKRDAGFRFIASLDKSIRNYSCCFTITSNKYHITASMAH